MSSYDYYMSHFLRPDSMLISMNDLEINRFKVLQDVIDKRLKQVDAAKQLNLSTRQIHRLLYKLSHFGVSSLAHGNRGKPSNHRYSDAYKTSILKLVRENYTDFSPTKDKMKPLLFHFYTLVLY